MITKEDLLRSLPLRGLRADVGTKSSRKGGATALVDLEPATAFEAVNAVTTTVLRGWEGFEDPELVLMCFDYIVLGVEDELREHFGPELPALRVVVREVLPHPVEANELNNRWVGKRVIREALRQLEEAEDE